MRRVCSIAVLLVALVGAAPAAAQDPIQPGDYHETSVGGCTLSFAYDGAGAQAGRVYMGTAAHCVDRVGEDVMLEDGTVFGDVAIIGNEGATVTDWAFIEVRPEFVARVSPAMKGHPTLPRTGYTMPAETSLGDTIQLSGYGVGFGITSTTREQRQAKLTYDDTREYTVLATLIFGDSGGPLVHVPTGKAIGIVSRLCVGLCEEEGPTVQGILAQASGSGFTVSLRTVS